MLGGAPIEITTRNIADLFDVIKVMRKLIASQKENGSTT